MSAASARVGRGFYGITRGESRFPVEHNACKAIVFAKVDVNPFTVVVAAAPACRPLAVVDIAGYGAYIFLR